MTRDLCVPASKRVFALALVFVCAVCLQAANAQTTIHVPADQPTIQAAITAAQPGDTVLVAPGTYVENIDFQGKAITVTSSDGAAVTIVDGGAVGPVASFRSGEGTGSVLNGLTLRNGVPSDTFPFFDVGGGIVILNSSPTITNNVITGNHAICGIGMEIEGGSAVIRGNTITGNTQAGGDGGCGGGGIEVTGDFSHPIATPLITGNTITNNSLLGGGEGGGIEVAFNAAPIIQNNFISGNAVFNFGGGIDLEGTSGTPVVVVQNIIVNNSTGGGGSGGGVFASRNTILTGNTIVGNTAFDGSSGVFADELLVVTISNNIVVATTGQTGIVCGQFNSNLPTFSHNDVTSPGGGQAYSSHCVAAAQGNGNISLDPQFVNASGGDYHLLATSPAVDAGDNGAPNLPTQDYDGNPRIVDGNNDGISTVDIGAYELQAGAQGSFSPASLSFANQAVNTTSSAQSVTLTATGNTFLNVSLTTTGDFAQTNTCGAGIPAGQSCVVNVTFTPSASGTRTGTLSLNGNAGSVALSGTGVNTPVASVSPSAINFGNQTIGTESTAQTVIVTNTGGATLHINSQLISGDPDFFLVASNCVGNGVEPGGICAAQLVFFPHSAGAGSATLTFGSDAINGPVSVSISGTGANPPVASVSPTSISFGSLVVGTESPTQTVTVTNTGGATLHINSVVVSGDPDFFTVSGNCVAGSAVAPGVSCTAQVVFFPHSAGAGSATLTIGSDAANNPVSVSISGTGVNPPLIAVSPTSINFGSLAVGTESTTQTVTVTNTGGSALHINSQLVSGDPDFFIVTSNCVGGAGVAPGGSCSAQVVFFPHSAGAGSATLTFGSDAANGAASVSLSGTGVDFAISASPSSVSVRSGHSVQTTILVSAVGGSFSNAVGLSCSGLPQGASCAFSPASVTPGATSTSSRLTINTQSGGTKTPRGTYHITVNGSSSGLLHSTVITLTVTQN